MHADRDDLLQAATAAAGQSYCPYSGYPVGAAILAEDGRIFGGCNVENASFGLTVCAERVALFRAVAEGVRRFAAVAIVAPGPQLAYPCGACRQALAEFCGDDTPVHVAVPDRPASAVTIRLGDLLPHAFRLRHAERRQ